MSRTRGAYQPAVLKLFTTPQTSRPLVVVSTAQALQMQTRVDSISLSHALISKDMVNFPNHLVAEIAACLDHIKGRDRRGPREDDNNLVRALVR